MFEGFMLCYESYDHLFTLSQVISSSLGSSFASYPWLTVVSPTPCLVVEKIREKIFGLWYTNV